MEKMLNEVRSIARENGVDLDRAFDMFRSNSESRKENYKGTGTFDFNSEIDDKTFGLLRKEVLSFNKREKNEN